MASDTRWPPAHDWDSLKTTIADLAKGLALEHQFFLDRNIHPEPEFCQGDVLRLDADFPFIDAAGNTTVEEKFERWLIVGNTCDLYREADDAGDDRNSITQMIPVLDMGARTDEELRDLQQYRTYRAYYLPPWDESSRGHVYAADFLRPVTAMKGALRRGTIEARLSQYAWILLNACIVRFQARDDGRFD